MAQFTPYQSTPRDPSYLGLSKEPDALKGDSSFGSLFEGLGNVATVGLKAVDEINQTAITNELMSSINAERNENIGVGLDLLKNGSTTSPEGLVADQEQSVPGPVAQGIARMNKLRQANKEGKFDDVSYYGNMQTITQNLTSRYPGYAEFIQQKASQILGTNAANAQRNAIQQTLSQLQGNQRSSDERWRNDVEKFAQFLGPQLVARALSPEVLRNPAAQDQFRILAANIQHQKFLQDRAKDELDFEMKSNQVSEARVEEGYHKVLAPRVAAIIQSEQFVMAGNSFKLGDLNTVIDKMLAEGGTPDRKLLAEIGLGLGRIKTAIQRAGAELAIQEPFSSKFKDSSKLAAAIKRYENVIDVAAQHVGAGNLYAATNEMNTLAGRQEHAALEVMKAPIVQRWTGMSKALGQAAGPVINEQIRLSGGVLLKDVNTQLDSLNLKDTATRGGSSLKTYLDRYNLVNPNSTTPEAQREKVNFIDRTIKGTKAFVLDKNATLETKIAGAEVITHAGTTEFIRAFTPEEQHIVWTNLASPAFAAEMKKVGDQNPETWRRFTQWQTDTFVRLHATDIDTVTQAARDTKGLGVKLDESTGLLMATPVGGSNRTKDTNLPLIGNTTTSLPINTSAKASLDRINKGLTILNNTLKQEGKKVTPEYLLELGIDIKGGTFKKSEGFNFNLITPAQASELNPNARVSATFEQVRDAEQDYTFGPQQDLTLPRPDRTPKKKGKGVNTSELEDDTMPVNAQLTQGTIPPGIEQPGMFANPSEWAPNLKAIDAEINYWKSKQDSPDAAENIEELENMKKFINRRLKGSGRNPR